MQGIEPLIPPENTALLVLLQIGCICHPTNNITSCLVRSTLSKCISIIDRNQHQ